MLGSKEGFVDDRQILVRENRHPYWQQTGLLAQLSPVRSISQFSSHVGLLLSYRDDSARDRDGGSRCGSVKEGGLS
jgi:hypothetical protein